MTVLRIERLEETEEYLKNTKGYPDPVFQTKTYKRKKSTIIPYNGNNVFPTGGDIIDIDSSLI
jgi:hypothetical protein